MENSIEKPVTPNKSLPSVESLFQTSIENFKQSFVSFLILFLANIAVVFIFIVIGLITSSIIGISIFSVVKSTNPQVQLASILSNPGILVTLGVVILITTLVFVVINLTFSIANIFVADKAEHNISFGEILQKSLPLIVPYLLISIMSSIISIPGFFVFIIPGFLLMFIFMFSSYEVILGDKRGINALRSSYQIISQNFWQILFRFLILLVINFIIHMILYMIQLGFSIIPIIGPIISVAISLFSSLITIILTWFGISYSITLYKQARAIADPNKTVNMAWIWIVFVIGILFMIAASFGVYKFASSPIFQNLIKQFQSQSQNPNLEQITQSRADLLAQNTFSNANNYRKQGNLPLLQNSDNLCSYTQRRVDQISTLGHPDNHSGFLEDLKDKSITSKYFTGFSYVDELSYTTTSNKLYTTNKPEDVVNYWSTGSSDNALNNPNYTYGCIKANNQFLVMVVGATQQTSKKTQASTTSIPTPTVDQFMQQFNADYQANQQKTQQVQQAQQDFLNQHPSFK